jgi:hypothetical protein
MWGAPEICAQVRRLILSFALAILALVWSRLLLFSFVFVLVSLTRHLHAC